VETIMNFGHAIKEWKAVDVASAGRLAEARLQAHWAAQVIAAVGEALVPAEADFSHTSLRWDDGRGMLLGRPLPESGLQVGLRLPALELAVLDGALAVRESFSLEGNTLAGALDRVTRTLADLMVRPMAKQPELPTYEMPEHPAGAGAPFPAADRGGLAELARWYGNAAALMDVVSAATSLASPVRCWPHHFDIATLLTLDSADAGDGRRYIGFGLSPGDASYGEPYLYVNPWPYPEAAALPELAGGGLWHREGWTGAVLPASRLTAGGAGQAAQAVAYLRSALAAQRTLLKRPGDGFWRFLDHEVGAGEGVSS